MSFSESVMKDLLRIIPQKSKIDWIGVRCKKKEDLLVVGSVTMENAIVTVGDHFK